VRGRGRNGSERDGEHNRVGNFFGVYWGVGVWHLLYGSTISIRPILNKDCIPYRYTMSIARRLFTTTTRRCNGLATPETPAQLSAIDLPPTIYTIIARHIAMSPPSSTYTIPNPFLMHKPSSDASTSSSVPQHSPRAISRRREKQLLDHYSGFVLPPSDLNRLPETPSIRWVNGEEEVTVTWSGEVGEEQNKTLYGSRRRMFKGHKHERERPERERETKERMSGMEKRINDWRSVSCLLLRADHFADGFSHKQMPNRRLVHQSHSSDNLYRMKSCRLS
jgi:hypothetical protein